VESKGRYVKFWFTICAYLAKQHKETMRRHSNYCHHSRFVSLLSERFGLGSRRRFRRHPQGVSHSAIY